MSVLVLTVRFLNPLPAFHGRADDKTAEWPPSPLRVFQAIVAAASARWKGDLFHAYAIPLLRWLERQPPPEIIAPSGKVGDLYRTAVPNNDLDKVMRAWTGGNYSNVGDANPATHRSLKTVQPTWLHGGNSVRYVYQLVEGDSEFEQVRESLVSVLRSVTHVGWGVDMASMEASVLGGVSRPEETHCWRPTTNGGIPLRTSKVGTLDALIEKHTDFVTRSMNTGTPFTAFNVMHYYSPTAGLAKAPQRPMAAFEIHRTIEDQEEHAGKSRFRPFHPVRRVATVAGMVRHATAEVAKLMGKEDDWINTHIQGHGNEKEGQSTSDERLMYLPLPSIQPVVGVGAIRRVLIVGWPGCKELSDLRRRLNGAELTELPRKKNDSSELPCELELPEQTEKSSKKVAMLAHLATSDSQVQQYLGTSRCWCTVTPVILPGFDDPGQLRRKYVERVKIGEANAEEQKHLLERLDCRTLALLWKAFEQAGWTSDMLEGAELEYRKVGWLRGQDLAANYCFASKYAKYHVRVTFKHPVAGPIVIGAGRYRGFGLFTKLD